MKYIKLLTFFALTILLSSCDRDLPYPIDGVKEGVAIDINRIPGTNGVIADGTFGGDYRVKLLIPAQQGDYSHMAHAQLVAVYTAPGARIPSKSAVVIDNITEFNKEYVIDLENVYSKLGLPGLPEAGEKVEYTTNVVLKNGYVVYGWTTVMIGENETQIWNNNKMSGWTVEGRPYSYKVAYNVACPFNINDYVGKATMTDNSALYDGEQYEVELVKVSDTQLKILNFAEEDTPEEVLLNITTRDDIQYVDMPKAIILEDKFGYTNFYVIGSGIINTCQKSINISGTLSVDQGTFGDTSWVIEMH